MSPLNTNYRPIALPNTIYKSYARILISLLISYNKQHQILHYSQEGSHPTRKHCAQNLNTHSNPRGRQIHHQIHLYINL